MKKLAKSILGTAILGTFLCLYISPAQATITSVPLGSDVELQAGDFVNIQDGNKKSTVSCAAQNFTSVSFYDWNGDCSQAPLATIRLTKDAQIDGVLCRSLGRNNNIWSVKVDKECKKVGGYAGGSSLLQTCLGAFTLEDENKN
jgi:hypothetical protein